MKKLLILLFIPLVSFSQDLKDLSVERSKAFTKKVEGVYYHKNGVFKVVAVGGSGFTSINRMIRKADKQMNEFATQNNYTYKLIKTDKERGGPGIYTTAISWFFVYKSDGSLVIDKDEGKEKTTKKSSNDSRNNAIEELKQLKELLDLEIITKEEFEGKSKELKKIILE